MQFNIIRTAVCRVVVRLIQELQFLQRTFLSILFIIQRMKLMAIF